MMSRSSAVEAAPKSESAVGFARKKTPGKSLHDGSGSAEVSVVRSQLWLAAVVGVGLAVGTLLGLGYRRRWISRG